VSSSLRRGAAAATLALSLSPLAACAAGQSAETVQIKPDNAAAIVGNIQIHNAVVLTTRSGTGPATISARIYNNGSTKQALVSVTVGSATKARLSDKNGGQSIVIPANGSVLLGGKGNPSATIPSLPKGLKAGDFQTVTFTFSQTGKVPVQALAEPATGYYAPYGPSVTPSPSVSTLTSSPSASASASVSESPAH
jgi:copper(I)-binding protein